MMFAVENPTTWQKIAAGVESFTADGGSCVLPKWMQKSIGVDANSKVRVTLSNFPSADSVIFQPFTEEFNRLPNPRVVLEFTLRQMPCLTEGSVLPIEFNSNLYHLKVLKTSPQKCVSIIHADVITDFAQPLNTFTHHWGEEEEAEETRTTKKKSESLFQGKSHSIRAKT
jgi:ubiquitin fusion degradation protein 1